MDKAELLEKMKRFYASTFDLATDQQVGDEVFSLYGHFNVDNSQYVLSKKAKLWEANCQEHLLVRTVEDGKTLCEEDLRSIDRFLQEYVEPEYVRHGEKLPPQNHMYTYLTVVLITEGDLDRATAEYVKKYKFEKTYLLNIRGYMETRLVVVSLKDRQVATNRAGKSLVKLYQKLLG